MIEPQVSIIIPTYNHAHFLGGALRSVMQQTFTAWEALVIDDGSADDPSAVVATLADPRIRLIRQTNQGLSAARNTGIRQSKGTYLAFLDADDEWDSTFLQQSVTTLLAAPSGIVGTYSRNYYISSTGERLPRLGGRIVPPADFQEQLWQGGFFPVHAVLVRTDIVRAVGLFDTQLTSLEDWDLWLRIAQIGAFQGIPLPLAGYRTLANSMSTNVERMYQNRLAILQMRVGAAAHSATARMAYAYAERTAAFSYFDTDRPVLGWTHFVQAADYWPALLLELDSYYELALSGQVRGKRGVVSDLAIEHRAEVLLEQLAQHFSEERQGIPLAHIKASAQVALAMLADKAGKWRLARYYLRCAIWNNPHFLWDRKVIKRYGKLLLGQGVVNKFRGFSLVHTKMA